MLSRQPPSQNVPISVCGRHARHPHQAQNTGKSSASGVLPLREADARSPPPPGRCKAGARKEKPGEIGVSDCTALGTFWQPQVRQLGRGRKSFPPDPLAVTVPAAVSPGLHRQRISGKPKALVSKDRPRCPVGGAGGGRDDSQAGRNGDLEA